MFFDFLIFFILYITATLYNTFFRATKLRYSFNTSVAASKLYASKLLTTTVKLFITSIKK